MLLLLLFYRSLQITNHKLQVHHLAGRITSPALPATSHQPRATRCSSSPSHFLLFFPHFLTFSLSHLLTSYCSFLTFSPSHFLLFFPHFLTSSLLLKLNGGLILFFGFTLSFTLRPNLFSISYEPSAISHQLFRYQLLTYLFTSSPPHLSILFIVARRVLLSMFSFVGRGLLKTHTI